jgi:hypothetical protein
MTRYDNAPFEGDFPGNQQQIPDVEEGMFWDQGDYDSTYKLAPPDESFDDERWQPTFANASQHIDPALLFEIQIEAELLTLEHMERETSRYAGQHGKRVSISVTYYHPGFRRPAFPGKLYLVVAALFIMGVLLVSAETGWGNAWTDPVLGSLAGSVAHVEDSPQVCNPALQADWQHKGYNVYGGGDEYHAWLECNPPAISPAHIPDGCSMYAHSSYDPMWIDPNYLQNEAQWLANPDLAWKTNDHYWQSNPVFATAGANRLPYNYPIIFTPAWDISGAPGAPDDSSVIMPQLEKIGKQVGAQLLLCQDSHGYYSFAILYWASIHNISGPPQSAGGQANFEYWNTMQLKPLWFWNGKWRTWYATAVLPGISGKFDAGTRYYCVTLSQSKDQEDNPPSEMTAWEIDTSFAGTAADPHHGCIVTAQGLNI